jgi:UDP-glucose 4-epimerase
LAQAHYLAVKYLNNDVEFEAFNLGTGTGYSVKQVIELDEKITQKKIRTVYADRKGGYYI